MAFQPAPDQARVLAHDSGTVLVTGPPGSGKTTLLRERFARLVEGGGDPERVVLFALDRRAARDGREHLIRRLARSLPDLPVFTAHGFAFGVLGRRFRELDYEEPPGVLSAPEQYSFVREMLLEERAAEWPSFARLLPVPGFARELADFVLRAQERLLDPASLEELVEASGRREYAEVARFYGRYLGALSLAGQTDFGGLLFQSVSLLRSSLAAEERYEHVLVDDYQDATLATEALVRALASSARTVVVAADPDAHVFSYRGGTLEPLVRLSEDVPGDGIVRLEHSHRLGQGVSGLDPLVHPDAPPSGKLAGLEARLFSHPGEEVDAIAREALRLRVDEDVRWEDIAIVLRRYGPFLAALRHALSRHGVPHVIVAEGAALANEPATRPVIDLLRYVFREKLRDELLEPLLVSSVVGLDPHQLRRLRREARKGERPLRSLVEEGPLAPLPTDLGAPVRRFRELAGDIPAIAARCRPDDLFFELWDRLGSIEHLASAEDPTGQRALDALSALADVLSRFCERRPGATIEDYLDTLEAAEFGPEPWTLPEERYPHAVRILSAHGSQGLEFDAVLVGGCVEGEFPNLAHADPMVSLAELLEDRGPTERLAARLAEERALFRLAVSRARRRTVLFASSSSGTRAPRAPSRFASRLGLAWMREHEEREPVSLRGMEAALRRTLSDSSADPVSRLAAAAALPRVGSRPDSWWGRRDWSDPGIPLYGDEIRTSYSRLSSMENCALQYLYSVEMGLDQEETYQMWVGSVVHDVIDRVQRGEVPKTLEAVHGALDTGWRKDIFPNRAVEHRKYLDARGMLERWLRHESAEPIRSELPFEFRIDGAVVRGRIDAVFAMNNGHARVVDYKTSMYAPTEEEAKRDLQLAAYYLALKRAPELSGLPEPGYLQLAYIAKPHLDGFVRRNASPNTDPGYEAWAEEAIRDLLTRIRVEQFGPSPEADCRFCPFKTICPRWPQGVDLASAPAAAIPA